MNINDRSEVIRLTEDFSPQSSLVTAGLYFKHWLETDADQILLNTKEAVDLYY